MNVRAHLAALGLALAFAGGAVAAPEESEAEQEPATVIDSGSVAYQQVVAVGRDAVVAGVAHSDVAALSGSVKVTGTVHGDVIVMSGNVQLGPAARVGGDVFVLGGRLDADPGATIVGRTVAYPTASVAWLTLLEGPTLGIGSASPLVMGAKLALLAAWMALTLLLFATAGRPLLATSEIVRAEPGRSFLTGLLGVIALVLTGLLFTAVAPGLVGVPLLVLVALFALLLKLWGMVAVFHALGAAVLRRLNRPRPLVLNAAALGLVLLGAAKFAPYLGIWTWSLASLIGVGASLQSKFGRREAWFSVGELDPPAAAPRVPF